MRIQRTPRNAPPMQLIAKRIRRTRGTVDEIIGETPGGRAKFRRRVANGIETYETIWVCDIDLADKHGPRVGDTYQRTFDPVNYKHGLWEKVAHGPK